MFYNKNLSEFLLKKFNPWNNADFENSTSQRKKYIFKYTLEKLNINLRDHIKPSQVFGLLTKEEIEE